MARLWDAGSLEPSDPIGRFVQQLVGTDKHDISVPDLLTNQSGFDGDPAEGVHGAPVDIVLEEIALCPLRAKRETTASYSRVTGWFLLGLVIERATGVDLPSALRALVFGPLGAGVLVLGVDAGMRAALGDRLASAPVPFLFSGVAVQGERALRVDRRAGDGA